MTRRSRKWTLALWGAGLSTLSIVGGIVVTLLGKDGNILVTQGFAAFGGVLMLYSAANVTQKATQQNAAQTSNNNDTGR